MTTRIRFEEELKALKIELVNMCRLTEQMIGDAIAALSNQDRALGASLADTDKRVDEYELDIEKKCMRLLLRQQPVAKDFREVSTALKMITDIERIGDQARDIGDIVATLPEGDTQLAALPHFPQMGDAVAKMVRDSVNSFVKNDEKLADEVIESDDIIDSLFIHVKNELIELIKNDAQKADLAIMYMMIAKYLERIGDHAVNVCEWTKYNESGVHIKY